MDLPCRKLTNADVERHIAELSLDERTRLTKLNLSSNALVE